MTARHRTSTDHVNATVIGLSKGATNNSAVSEPKRGPRTPRSPITIGIVVREQPGINAPAAIATGNPVRPPSARAAQRSGTSVRTTAAAATPIASHGNTLTLSEPKRDRPCPSSCTG